MNFNDFRLINKAMNFANKALEGVFRKRSRLPYIIHPTRVATQLLVEGIKNSVIIASAILHDILEETQFISRYILDDTFGKEITNLVVEMTDPISIKDKYLLQKYKVQRIKNYSSPEATLIALADKTDNLRDLDHELNSGLILDISAKQYYYCEMGNAFHKRESGIFIPAYGKLLKEYDELILKLF